MQFCSRRIPLDEEAAEQCFFFQMICRQATGMFKFITGFYGLYTRTTELQKKLGQSLDGVSSTYRFIDDTLAVTKGTKAEPWRKVEKF